MRFDINTYGKTGPFGETLYFVLAQFKRFLVEGLSCKYNEPHHIRAIRESVLNGIEKLDQDKEGLVRKTKRNWPSGEDGSTASPREMHAFAESRWKELREYLSEIYEYLQEEGSSTPKPKRAFGALTWPYCFIRYSSSNGSGKEEELDLKVTWMPHFDLLKQPYNASSADELAEGISASNWLYPSLHGASKETEKYVKKWLDQGLFSLRPRAENILHQMHSSREIGHVQQFLDRDQNIVYVRDLINDSERERSRFPDCVYLNRSALQVPLRDNTGRAYGVLFVCSPVNLIGHLTSKDCKPSSEGVSEVAEVVNQAWGASEAPQITAVSLKEQYKDLRDRLLRQIDKQVQRERRRNLRTISAHISHTLGNALGGLGDNKDDHRVIQIERLQIKAIHAILATKANPVVNWGNAWEGTRYEHHQESVGDLIEDSNSDSEFELTIEDDPLCEIGEVDARLVGIMVELARNRSANRIDSETEVDRAGKIEVTRESKRFISIRMETRCTPEDADAIKARLEMYEKAPERGVRLIPFLAEDLLCEKSSLEWSFRSEAIRMQATWTGREKGVDWSGDNPRDGEGKGNLQMTFEAKNLITTPSKP